MVARRRSLSLIDLIVESRRNRRLAQLAGVMLVASVHGALWLWLAGDPEHTLPSVITTMPLAVRWIDTPAAVEPVTAPPPVPPEPPKPPEPPPPTVVPAQPPPPPVPTVERPLPKAPRPPPAKPPAASTRPATSQPEATAPIAPAARPDGPHDDSPRGDTPPPATPPRADAAYLSNPVPDYPAEARRNRQEGQVLLRVLVTTDGHAQSVSIERSSGFALLNEAAVDAVRKWRFTPGHRGNVAVDDWVLIPISFRLRK